MGQNWSLAIYRTNVHLNKNKKILTIIIRLPYRKHRRFNDKMNLKLVIVDDLNNFEPKFIP